MRAQVSVKTILLLCMLPALASCADSYHRYDHAAVPSASSRGDAWGSESPSRTYHYPARYSRPAHDAGNATAK